MTFKIAPACKQIIHERRKSWSDKKSPNSWAVQFGGRVLGPWTSILGENYSIKSNFCPMLAMQVIDLKKWSLVFTHSSSAFAIMPDTICTCWRAAILGGCVLQFEIAQMLISGPNSGTGRQSCPAAVHWMQFQARGFVPTNRLHFITHTNAIDCADQCAQRCSAPASAGFRRNYIFTKSCHGPHGP